MSFIIAYLCSNYLLYSKLWRRIKYYTNEASKYYTTIYAASRCITKEPEYYIVIAFVLSHNHLVLI
jgi:hypothetical protein